MIDFSIDLYDIEIHYNAVKEDFQQDEYVYVLDNLLTKMKQRPKSFASVMDDWLKRNRTKEVPERPNRKDEPVSEEMLPDWFKENPYQEKHLQENEQLKEGWKILEEEKKKDSISAEEKKTEIEEMLKRLRS